MCSSSFLLNPIVLDWLSSLYKTTPLCVSSSFAKFDWVSSMSLVPQRVLRPVGRSARRWTRQAFLTAGRDETRLLSRWIYFRTTKKNSKIDSHVRATQLLWGDVLLVFCNYDLLRVSRVLSRGTGSFYCGTRRDKRPPSRARNRHHWHSNKTSNEE